MKAKDLMIGDIVQLSNNAPLPPKYVSVHAIKYNHNFTDSYLLDIVFCDSGVIQFNYSLRSVEPIPLTPEILEKNSDGGFFYHDCPIIGYNGKRSTCHIGRASLYVEWERISMKPYIEIHGLGDTFYKNFVAGVHELQHALKLCGINKEIVV